jgi:ribosomal protein L37AE/L43A
MQFPTWNDVCVPADVADSIRHLPPCYLLDSLIHQLVFRKKRKPQYTYSCAVCTHKWKPERSNEEITSCPACNRYLINCAAQLRFSKQIPGYTKRSSLLDSVVEEIPNLFNFYFDRDLQDNERLIDVGWEENGMVYAQLLGGEKIRDYSPRMSLIKAIALCPYLWDNGFSWNELESESKNDQINVEHIGPFLHNYCHGPWIGRPDR